MISIEELYRIFLDCTSVATDSRSVDKGSLFFALKGDNFDGNAFASGAIEKGASYAIIDDPGHAVNNKTILVDDVLETLQKLSLFHRKQLKIPVIAITGTNGKTTTKELVNSVLSQKNKTTATTGNLNNHIGVPLTLLSIGRDTRIAIIEMGANHVGEIDMLCNIALPTHGIITNIGKAHLEGFGGFEGVIKAKTELFNYLRSSKGIAFVNKDNDLLMEHSRGLRAITYGSDPSAAFNGSIIGKDDPFLSVQVSFKSMSLNINSRLFGRYNFENIVAAACIGCHFKVEPDKIKAGIEQYVPANNRSQLIDTGRNILIKDAYNANPDSLQNAIRNFETSSYSEKTLIIGDMLELGEECDEEHKKILDLIEKSGFTDVFLVGPVFTRLNTRREWMCFQDSELARLWFDHHPLQGKTILVKGSRGIMLEKVYGVF